MPVTQTECPDCRVQGKLGIPLHQEHGAFFSYCENGHKFNDSAELAARNPKILPIRAAQAPKAPVPGLVTMEIKVPDKLKDALVVRFGVDKLNASLPHFLNALLDPNAFIINGEDAQNISSKAGVEVKNSQALAGVVYSMKQDIDNLNQKVKTLEASRGNGDIKPSTGGFTVSFTPEYVGFLREQAVTRQESVEELIQDVVLYVADKCKASQTNI